MSIDLSKYKIEETKSSSQSSSAERTSWLDLLNKDIKFPGSGALSDKKKEWFYAELQILLEAGVDIKSSLELIAEEQPKQVDRDLFEGIKNRVVNGESLSESIYSTGKFTPYEYYSLKIGEQSGEIIGVLSDLSSFFTKKIAQRRQIVNALSYPVIVTLAALGAIFFMLNFIVPMFADIFKRSGGKLPGITQTIIDLSDVVTTYGGYVILMAIALILAAYLQRDKDWFRRIFSKLILSTPFVGTMVQKVYLARFCYSMNLLLAAKTPIIEALALVQKMVGFYPIEQSLTPVKDGILKGEALYQTMSAFPIYNKRMVSLVKVAEEVNQLDLIFNKLAKQYNDEVDHQASLISSMLEPFIIIFLGLFVAIILIAMYLPLFQLSNSFGV